MAPSVTSDHDGLAKRTWPIALIEEFTEGEGFGVTINAAKEGLRDGGFLIRGAYSVAS